MTTGFEVVTTRSGARAVRDAGCGEIMHPVGPLAESERLYAAPSRLAERLAEPGDALTVLDVGLGAGSNAAAAYRVAESRPPGGRQLRLVSFDRTAAALALVLDSDHRADFGIDEVVSEAARTLLREGCVETERISWRLVLGELPATLEAEPAFCADIVFWDPFSPRANPDLWNVAAFATLRRVCRDGATVHTYSASTKVRAAMLLAGFAVGLGAPTGTKLQTTCAATRAEDLEDPLGARWLERLGRSSAPFPDDAPGDAMDRVGRAPQFLAGR